MPQVFLGMPRYGAVAMGAARNFCAPSSSAEHVPNDVKVRVVAWSEHSTSLLTLGFNVLLGEALCWRDQGRCTHFAMIHSDIEPAAMWLNALWAEMRRTGADLISAVVPLKDHTGRTSTAISRVDNPWKLERYIMLADRDWLPSTFAAKDCCKEGEELLVNTGLWLADLRRPWWDDFAFHAVDRILKREDGTREASCRSEDWEMSRHLNRAGAKVVATWVVPLAHHGGGVFHNHVKGTA